MADDGGLLLRVFTHPACPGCSSAISVGWKLSQEHSALTLRTVTLSEDEGRVEAQAEGIKTIPTVILSRLGEELDRWVGTPEPAVVEAALETSVRG